MSKIINPEDHQKYGHKENFRWVRTDFSTGSSIY